MRHLPITLDTPAENLALDEVMLDLVVRGGENAAGWCRVWESATPMVVVGRATQVELEVDTAACARRHVPVLRRVSGGATIVTGPGCLMYAVALPLAGEEHLTAVDACHERVLGPLSAALSRLIPTVHRAGTSDLAYRDPAYRDRPAAPARKFSGNSLRVTRGGLLYHGTLLYDFDLPLVSELLRTPPRQPDYRKSRTHAEFIDNLPVDRNALQHAVAAAWPIEETLDPLPEEIASAVADKVAGRYAVEAWHRSR